MFICKIRPRYEDSNPIIEYYQAGDFVTGLTQNGDEVRDQSYYDFLVQFMGGEYVSGKRPLIKIKNQKLNSEAKRGPRTLTIEWEVDGHEPLGLNRLWWAYIQYESGVSCEKVDNCFTKDNIVAKREGYNYYNILTFGDINLISKN